MKLRAIQLAAIPVAASLMPLLGASAQEPTDAEPNVSWTTASGETQPEGSASSGAKIARDPNTGELRAPLPGELPLAASDKKRPTEVIKTAKGTLLIVGDDLMSDAMAIKRADGTLAVDCGQAETIRGESHGELEEK